MAEYTFHGGSETMFTAYAAQFGSVLLSSRVISVSESGLTYTNHDGSTTTVTGSGFIWDGAQGLLTSGTIDAIERHSADGALIDRIENIMVYITGFPTAPDAINFQSTLEQSGVQNSYLQYYLLSGNDVIDFRPVPSGTSSPVWFEGMDGDDRIYGSNSDDTLFGDARFLRALELPVGDDVISGGAGNDVIYGCGGLDRLAGQSGNDLLIGGSEDDVLRGGTGIDILSGGTGNDTMDGGYSIDTAIFAGTFADYAIEVSGGFTTLRSAYQLDLYFDADVDTLTNVERLAFDDGIYVWNGDGAAWAKISSRSGESLKSVVETIDGTSAANTIVHTHPYVNGLFAGTLPFYDIGVIIRGFGGNDDISGSWGNDLIYGGAGNDTLTGDVAFIPEIWGLDTPYARDRIYGQGGNDIIMGNTGDDWLNGGSGRDTINGGVGNNKLWGGTGADTFVFDSIYNDHGYVDIIHDFEVGVDHLDILGMSASYFDIDYFADNEGNAVLLVVGSTIILLNVNPATVPIESLLQ